MKKIIFFLFLSFSIFSCKKNSEFTGIKTNEYASNFSIEIKNNELEVISSGVTTRFPLDFKVKKCIITGTSASAYIDALGKFSTIAGVCSPQYFYNPKIAQKIKDHSIENIGNDGTLNFEKIIALQPDLIITSHNSNYEKVLNQLSKTGIKIIYVEEYNELHPLGKTEYLKLFGILFKEQQKADSIYISVKKNYLSLKEKASSVEQKPNIFTNIMYGDAWYMAGGKSFISTLFSDAGTNYLWKDSPETGTIALSFEEVFSKAKNAEYWIGASNFASKKELLNSNPHYEWFNAYKNEKVYTMNQKENALQANDYYESGSIFADKVLSDVIKIVHPELLPEYSLTYLKQLK